MRNITKGIWNRFLVLIPIVVVMFFVSRAYVRSVVSTYRTPTTINSSMPEYAAYGLDNVTYEVPGVVQAVSFDFDEQGRGWLTLKALSDGRTLVYIGSEQDEMADVHSCHVENGGLIVDGFNFSGWEIIQICIALFLAITVALFASVLVRLVRHTYFGYEMVACGGGLLFCFLQLLQFVTPMLGGDIADFTSLAFRIADMAPLIIGVTLIPVGIAALLVSLSNIALIRHEGFRPVNLLCIAVSVVWIIANVLYVFWWDIGLSLGLSIDVLNTIDSIIATGIAFGECLLISTIVCAWLASRHVPKHAADYLIVLGCGLRPDGTPTPLLAGRVDRARAFDEARIAAGDAPATFVPSGGQGPDEVISEAQSMADYLAGQGVDRGRIVLEDRSSTTNENMAFSREVIEKHAGRAASELRVAFSTTNYHVFRGYVCAHAAGMEVEGMGSRTRFYFWPNAFLREFAGLLATQWRAILQTFIIIAALYAFMEYALIIG